MRPLRGNSALIATDRATGQEYVFRLPAPLRMGAPRRVEARFFEESLNRRTVNVITVGDPVYEVTAHARFVGRPQTWLDLLSMAADQRYSLVYVRDLSRPAALPVVAIHPDDALGMEADPDRFAFGEYEATIVLRTTEPLAGYLGTTPRLLIDWEAGLPFPAGGYSRSSPALYRDRSGAWRETAPNVPRTSWGTDPVTGLLVPRTLLEPGATNYASSTSVTGGESGLWEWTMPAPGRYRLTALVDAPAHASNYPGSIGPYAAAADEAVTLSAWIGTGSSPHLQIRASGFSATQPVVRDDGRQVITMTHTAPWVHSLAVYAPADVRADIRAGDYIELVLPQIEATPYATSPILTDGTPQDRGRDTLYMDLPDEVARPGVPLAIYARYVMGASGPEVGGNPGAWAITNAGGQAPRLQQNFHATGIIQLGHYRSGSEAGLTTVPLAPESGHLVETLTLIWPDNQGRLVGRLVARINGGPLAAADLPPLAPAAAWRAPRLYVGSRGAAPGAYEFEALKVYAGRLSGTPDELMAFMRRARQ